MNTLKYLFLMFLGTMVIVSAGAVETKIMIRVKAKDAKFVGSSIGGAMIKVFDAQSGQLLSHGKTSGSTGNTELIMKTAQSRGDLLTDEETAGFMLSLDIDEPILIQVVAEAPAVVNAKISSSTDLWVIPGKDILGDGIILELPGFIVDVLKPRAHQFISLGSLDRGELEVQANIVMMCGCTITEGGIWDAGKMEVQAVVSHKGEVTKELPLTLIENNLFSATMKISQPGQYEVMVYAYDPSSGNTGLDVVNYIIVE